MKKQERFVEVVVYGMAVEAKKQTPIILLSDAQRRILLPIWIGGGEAAVIMATMEGKSAPRPQTHDVLEALIFAGELSVLGVDIHRCEDAVYFADLRLRNDAGREVRIDCRPSDAIAVALRTGSVIRVAVSLLEHAQIFPERDDHHQMPNLLSVAMIKQAGLGSRRFWQNSPRKIWVDFACEASVLSEG